MITEKIGDEYFRMPTYMTFEEYVEWRNKKEEEEYFRQLSGLSSTNTSVNGKVDPIAKMDLEDELFNRLFGGTEVDIKPQGNIDLTFGVDFQNIENPILTQRQQRQGGFDFDMNIQLNVDGSIGEKLKLGTNYNTQATFDFDNQLKLEYDSDAFSEDDIIKKIEAGNVSLPLRSNLIQGAQSLFGLKTELQFGHLRLTAVASQQKSQRQEIEIQGGSQVQEFEVTAEEYDENRHFFLSHYNRDQFETALKNLPQINSLMRITNIEVWVTNDRNETEGIREVVALADLGEYEKITNENMIFQSPNTPRNLDVFKTNELPENSSNDLYEALVEHPNARFANRAVAAVTSPQFQLQQTRDFEKVRARLLSPNEYTYHAELGFLSVNVNLRPDQVLAVAYEYNYGGEERVYKVGELSNDVPTTQDSITENVLFVKMLKSTTQRTDIPGWDLMMKNIYSIGAYQVNREDFRLDIFYDDPGGGQKRFLPETNLEGVPLLRVFNLDNLNVQGDPQPDGVFDFVPNVTINTRNGRVMFPVLEPFGSDLAEQIDDPGFRQFYSFQMLYDSTVIQAREFPEFNRFTIRGSYKSAVSNEISLGSFNLPQGSIVVTAGAQVLDEGVDYEVDYQIGRIKILNDAILQSGLPIKVSFEDNALFGFQTKTLLGLRADYEVNENFSIGGTFLNLFERPFTQKVNIGDDPINNKIYGLDFNYSTESEFITRMVDRIPLIDTKAPSKVTMMAELAALRPGHSRAVNQVDSTGKRDDSGAVYLDDFEGSASSFDLRTPYTAWVPASVPQNDLQGNNPLFPESAFIDSTISNVNRAGLSWYRIDPSVRDQNDRTDPYAAAIAQEEVFRNRQLTPQDNPTIFTFDLTYCPEERGPYNFDVPGGTQYSAGVTEVGGKIKLENPETRWAGIMRALNTNDFNAANIEFVEFWMLNPFMQKPDGTATSGAGNLYINLGNISEDILRDSRLFFENGLPGGTANSARPTTETNLARIPLGPLVTTAFDNDETRRANQDVGYDGADNELEKTLFADYWNTISTQLNITLDDVSNDDFVTPSDPIYEDDSFSVPDRYSKFNNSQGNARTIGSISEIIGTNIPDSEDLNNDNTLSETEAYFEYKIPLVPQNDELRTNQFITDSIQGPAGRVWYRFKIPIDQYTNRVGSIQDFRSIRFIRMYMQGFDEKITLRFARLELVRNQWRRYRRPLVENGVIGSDPNTNQTLFDVNAVNVEENSSRQPFNYVLPIGIEREQSLGPFPNALQNEQSLSINICNLKPNDARGIFRNLNYDLRVYEGVQMFVHAELDETIDDLRDSTMSIFMRIGSDFEKNYYEYEIPLIYSKEAAVQGVSSTQNSYKREVWRDENEFKFPLELLKDIKLERNNTGWPLAQPFERNDPDIPVNRVKVVGNPNLGYVRGIMIGVRNIDPTGQTTCGEIWINELRVTGFDERAGYAGMARLDVQLADFGNLAASGSFSTIGWGALDQRLADRQRERIQQYDLAADFQLGKFLPENWGIKIPFYAQFSNIDRIPQFDPYDFDVPLQEKLESQTSKEARDSIRDQAIDQTTIKGFNFTNVRKERTSKDKKPMPWDISNFSFTYSQTETVRSDPLIEEDKLDEYRGQVDYNYSRKAGYITPFKKAFGKNKTLKKHLKFISDFNFNPLPNSFSFNTFADRHKAETKYRFAGTNPYFNTFVNKQFLWDRNYNLQWDLAKSLKINFNATSRSVIDELSEFNDDTQLRRTQDELNDFIWENIRAGGRDKRYLHDINVNYTAPFKSIPILDWINVKAQYRGNFSWDAGALNNFNIVDSVYLGNTIQNGQTRQINADLNFEKLYNKSKFLKKINRKPRAKNRRNARSSRGTRNEGTKNKSKKDDKKKKKKDKEPSKAQRTIVRPFMLLRKARFNYSEEFTTVIPGYNPAVDYLGQAGNFSRPGWDFVAGFQPGDDWFDRAVADPNDRWITKSFYLNQDAVRNYTKNYDARLTIEPFTDFRIDVDATYSFTENQSLLFKNQNEMYAMATTQEERDQFVDFGITNRRDVGSYTISYFAMQTLFKDGTGNLIALFNQFEENREVISQRLGTGVHEVDNQFGNYTEGYGRYQTDVLIPAFISAYTDRDPDAFMSSRDANIFNTLPRPNWRLTYNGLSKLKWFKEIFKDVKITHGYKSSLTVNQFNNELQFFDEAPLSQENLNPATSNYYSRFEIPNLVITEQFAPLLGLDVTTQNGMSIRGDFKKSRNLQMSFVDFQLSETRTTEYVVGFRYPIKNVIIPFLTGKKKPSKSSAKKKTNQPQPNNRGNRPGRPQNQSQGNDLNVEFDFSFRDDVTINHLLDKNIAEPTRGTRTIRISPAVTYDINSKLNLRLFFDYNKTVPKTSAAFPITNTQGGITVRFSLN
ncbi:MAG: cell surface protein SprA [Bacteroidota bacterium]